MPNPRLFVIDSCSIVNLYASGYFESLLASLEGLASVVDHVLHESQFIRAHSDNSMEEKEPIRLEESIANGFVLHLHLDTEIEFERYLELAIRLDDGEAATLALAASRGGTLVTDDRKALSIARELSVATMTTPEVLHRWSISAEVPELTLCEALENIRWRARFEPSRQHPLWSWWRSAIERP